MIAAFIGQKGKGSSSDEITGARDQPGNRNSDVSLIVNDLICFDDPDNLEWL